MTRKNLILLATGGSIALLIGARIFQYFGVEPCHLCWLQRYPHYAVPFIGLAALMVRGALIPALGGLATLTSAGIAAYHSGVERHWWPGPTSCTGGDVGALNPDQLFDQIMNAPLIRCDEIAWQMFGVTIPNLNLAFSLVLTVLWVMAARSSGRGAG